MGVATTNVLDRVMASVGLLPGGVAVRFERCEDVSQAGDLAVALWNWDRGSLCWTWMAIVCALGQNVAGRQDHRGRQ